MAHRACPFAALFGALALSACGSGGSDAAMVRVVGNDATTHLAVTVDFATDEVSRQIGLMGRASLAVGHGLLILLPAEGEACIVNEGVHFAIDAVFADAAGNVVATERAIAANDTTLRCHQATQQVLEVNANAAASVGIGDHLIITPP